MRKEPRTKRAGRWTRSADRAATLSTVRRSDIANGAGMPNGSPLCCALFKVVSTRIRAGWMIGESSLKAFRRLALGRTES